MALTEQKKTEDGKKIELVCEVSAADFEKAVQRAYVRENKKIAIPGFRKGKAPRHIIERMYGVGFFYDDAVNDLLPGMYDDALAAIDEEVIGQPEVALEKCSKEEGMVVRFTCELRPELTVKKYKGITAAKAENTVSDEQVQNELSQLQERNARMVSVEDRAAEDGDTVRIDFEGFMDGKAFDGGKAENSPLLLGSHSFIDTFEEQIVGHNIGDEFDVNVTFPEQYGEPTLAGKPAVFKVKLNEIHRKELPELDDEFAKDVSEFDTLDELKADILSHLTEAAEKRADAEFENALMEKIVDSMEGEIPAVLIEERIDDNVREFAYNMSAQGLGLDTYLKFTGSTPESLRESMRETATKHVKTRLALEAIVRAEGIEVSDEEIDAEYQRYADDYNMDKARVMEMVPVKSMRKDLACSKALDVVRTSGKVSKAKKSTKKDEE